MPDETTPRNRILIAHDLPMPAEDLGKQLQGVDSEWYIVRDPYLMIETLIYDYGEPLQVEALPGHDQVKVTIGGDEATGTLVEAALELCRRREALGQD